MVIGLHHVEDYKKIKISGPTKNIISKQSINSEIHGYNVEHGYHHYVITTRPRCMFCPDSFLWHPDKKKVTGELEFEVAYRGKKRIPFELFLDGSSPYPLPVGDAAPDYNAIKNVYIASGPMGHPNRIIIEDEKHSIGLYLEPDLLHFMKFNQDDSSDCLNFKIEYIGISTGEKGGRDFANRLWNHEKVREIAGVIQRDAPNLQIYVFAYHCSYAIEVMPGSFLNNTSILEHTLGMKSCAQIMEAALIGYFKPTYNTEFISFPAGKAPGWIAALKKIIRPPYEPQGKILLSVVMVSDNRYNEEAPWTFGRFYTDHTQKNQGRAIDICQIDIDLSLIN